MGCCHADFALVEASDRGPIWTFKPMRRLPASTSAIAARAGSFIGKEDAQSTPRRGARSSSRPALCNRRSSFNFPASVPRTCCDVLESPSYNRSPASARICRTTCRRA